jgi:hypothetical protein
MELVGEHMGTWEGLELWNYGISVRDDKHLKSDGIMELWN